MLGPCWRRAGQEGALALYFVFPTPLSFFFKLSTSKHCRPSKDCKPDDMLKGYWRQATEDQPRIPGPQLKSISPLVSPLRCEVQIERVYVTCTCKYVLVGTLRHC